MFLVSLGAHTAVSVSSGMVSTKTNAEIFGGDGAEIRLEIPAFTRLRRTPFILGGRVKAARFTCNHMMLCGVGMLVELSVATTKVTNYLLVGLIVVSRRCRLSDLLGFHTINSVKDC